jgi:ketosteroid isomerase-like protein
MKFESPAELVNAYVAAAQAARASHAAADFAKVRSLLADDVVVRLAGPWGDAPWRTVYESADDVVGRLAEPLNDGVRLTTENTNVIAAGEEVVVEQMSTIKQQGRQHVSMVCHIFTVIGDASLGSGRTAMTPASRPSDDSRSGYLASMSDQDISAEVREKCPHCGTEMQTATIDFDPTNQPRAELNPGEMAKVDFCPNPDCPDKVDR